MSLCCSAPNKESGGLKPSYSSYPSKTDKEVIPSDTKAIDAPTVAPSVAAKDAAVPTEPIKIATKAPAKIDESSRRTFSSLFQRPEDPPQPTPSLDEKAVGGHSQSHYLSLGQGQMGGGAYLSPPLSQQGQHSGASSAEDQQHPSRTRRLLYDPESEQMVEPTSVISSSDKPRPSNGAIGRSQTTSLSGNQRRPVDQLTQTSLGSRNPSFKRKGGGVEEAEGKWVRGIVQPAAAEEANAASEVAVVASAGSGSQEPPNDSSADAGIEKGFGDEGVHKVTSVLTRSGASGPERSVRPPTDSYGQVPYTNKYRKAQQAEDNKLKELRTKERLARGPRTKGLLFRYNEKGEIEPVLSAAELLERDHTLKAHHEDGADLEMAERKPQFPTRQEVPTHSSTDTAQKKLTRDATVSEGADVADQEKAQMRFDAAEERVQDLVLEAEAKRTYGGGPFMHGLGLAELSEERTQTSRNAAAGTIASSPERSRLIGQMGGLWSKSSPTGPTPLQMIQPQQDPNAALDQSLTRSNTALGLEDPVDDLLGAGRNRGSYSNLTEYGGLGGILQPSLLDSTNANNW